MYLKQKNRRMLKQAALHLAENDFVITNVQVFNVFTKEICPAAVYVKNGFTTYVDYDQQTTPPGLKTIDGQANYLLPGLIDAHTHIESTMLTPQRYAELVAPFGTTTVICDPHEIANAFGIQGLEYMLAATENVPLRVLFDIPSCVPSVEHLEVSGAVFHKEQIQKILTFKRVVGLAEVMDYQGVINDSTRMAENITAVENQGLYIQGHCPLVSQQDLAAYRIGGPISDHESSTIAEIKEKLRAGMYIDLKEANTTRNLVKFIKEIKDWPCLSRFTFCTDDRRANVIQKHGHINGIINKAMRAGLSPQAAVSFATINAAQEAQIADLGAIAPGYLADFVLTADLTDIQPLMIWLEGKITYQKQHLVEFKQPKTLALEKIDSIHIPPLQESDFDLTVPPAAQQLSKIKMNYIAYQSYTSAFTDLKTAEFAVHEGRVLLPEQEDFMFVAVINRYGQKHLAKALLQRFGINKGAIASTVSHDSHNLTVVYRNSSDALLAAKQVKQQKGGLVAVKDGQILAQIALPVAGLMTNQPVAAVNEQIQQLTQAGQALGTGVLANPISRMTIVSLLVSPYFKLSDLGLVDTLQHQLLPLFPDYPD